MNFKIKYSLLDWQKLKSRNIKCPGKFRVISLSCFSFLFYFFIFGCIGSSLQQAGATLRCGAWASHCGVLSCRGARALGVRASVVAACGLSSCDSQARRLSSCGARA